MSFADEDAMALMRHTNTWSSCPYKPRPADHSLDIDIMRSINYLPTSYLSTLQFALPKLRP
jgi:hypothetical protein